MLRTLKEQHDYAMSVTMTRQAVKDAPAYDPGETLSRADEARLQEHYGRTAYWADGERRATEISRI